MMTEFSVFFIGTVFVAGVLSFFSPCVFPLLPVYMGQLMDQEGPVFAYRGGKIYIRPILKTLAFIAGLSMVFFSLGFGAGFLGRFLYHPYTPYVLGGIVVILGLHQMEVINIRSLQKEKKLDFRKGEKKGMAEAFILGLTFSFAWTPCVGPVLGSVLAVAVSGGSSAWYGGFLMAVYTAGMAIPFLLLAAGSSFFMKYFSPLKKHMLLLKKLGGFLILLMGLVLMSGQFNRLAATFI